MDLYGDFVDMDEEVVVSFYMSLNQQIKSFKSVGKTATYRVPTFTPHSQ